MRSSASPYDQDFYAWTQEQAALLEGRQFDTLDLENLIEEVACLGRSERRALGSYLKNLLIHLLKWRDQPGLRQAGPSWRLSIRQARHAVEEVLEESPSLRREVGGMIARHYLKARLEAQDETSLPLATFPEACPWTEEQLLDSDFFPEE